jgi:hypothetical protein
MNELDQRIRDFIESNAAPVSVDEVFALAPAHRRPARGRRQHHRFLLLAGAAIVVLAVVSVSLVALPGPKSVNVPKASAAAFLDTVAVRAASEKALVPGPGQYLYVATITSNTDGESLPPSRKLFWYDSEQLIQTWTSPLSPSHETSHVVGRPIFVSAVDRATWIRDGSKPIGSGNSTGPSPSYLPITALPTTASTMLAFFRSQGDLSAKPSYESLASWEFSSALDYLQSGASSAQRAALLRFIAAIPGIRLLGHAESVATREVGSVVGLPIGSIGKMQEALFDPTSSTLIETRLVLTAVRPPLPSFPEPTPFVGEIQYYSDFVFAGITRTNSHYSLPPRTPVFPEAWPFTETREPLPGFLGSGKTQPHSGR